MIDVKEFPLGYAGVNQSGKRVTPVFKEPDKAIDAANRLKNKMKLSPLRPCATCGTLFHVTERNRLLCLDCKTGI